MRTASIFIIFLIINLIANAQLKSNYARGFDDGVKEGYCYNKPISSACFYPIVVYTPIPRINESSEDFNQGYNRGFQYGLDLKRSNEALNEANFSLNQQLVSYKEYVSQSPINAMVAVGMIKQAKYDTRAKWIQKRIDILSELTNNLFNEETLPSNINPVGTRTAVWKNVVDYAKAIGGYDFADDYQFSSIQANFNKIEKYLYDSYNQIISSSVQTESQSTVSSFSASSEKMEANNYSKLSSKKIYSGIVEVNTCSEILDKPDKFNGKIIVSACDGKVKIISKANEEFYKVEYKSTIGYLSERWIIK